MSACVLSTSCDCFLCVSKTAWIIWMIFQLFQNIQRLFSSCHLLEGARGSNWKSKSSSINSSLNMSLTMLLTIWCPGQSLGELYLQKSWWSTTGSRTSPASRKSARRRLEQLSFSTESWLEWRRHPDWSPGLLRSLSANLRLIEPTPRTYWRELWGESVCTDFLSKRRSLSWCLGS